MMQHEFLLSPQSFMKNTVAPDYAARDKQTRDAFKTTQTTINKNASDQESFENTMRSLQKRQAQQDQNNAARTDANNAAQSTDKSAFLTRISATNSIEAISLTEEDETLSAIGEKMLQILAALEQAKQDIAAHKSQENDKPTLEETALLESEMPQDYVDLAAFEILSLYIETKSSPAPLADTATHGTDDATIKADQSLSDIEKLLTQIMEKLRAMIEAEKSLLVTSNKTPQQLAEIQKTIEDALSQELSQQDRELLEKLAAQWSSLSLVPSDTKNVAQDTKAFEQQAIIAAKEHKQTSSPEQNHNSVNSDTKAAPAIQTEESAAKARYDERYNARYSSDSTQTQTPANTQGQQSKAAPADAPAMQQGQNAPAQTGTQTNTAALFELDTFMLGAPTIGAEGSLLYTDNSGTVVASTPSSSLQTSLVNVTTHAPHAAHAHPAMQTVMNSIQKIVKSGETSELKIQLDPPELGRVEIKMSMDKNNISKVVLTSEKPETHMMLQRDAHMLERILQDTGLFNDGGLSFELAENFDQGQHTKDGRTAAGNQNAGNEAEEIIETTMDWVIDPNTGAVHYSIWA